MIKNPILIQKDIYILRGFVRYNSEEKHDDGPAIFISFAETLEEKNGSLISINIRKDSDLYKVAKSIKKHDYCIATFRKCEYRNNKDELCVGNNALSITKVPNALFTSSDMRESSLQCIKDDIYMMNGFVTYNSEKRKENGKTIYLYISEDPENRYSTPMSVQVMKSSALYHYAKYIKTNDYVFVTFKKSHYYDKYGNEKVGHTAISFIPIPRNLFQETSEYKGIQNFAIPVQCDEEDFPF